MDKNLVIEWIKELKSQREKAVNSGIEMKRRRVVRRLDNNGVVTQVPVDIDYKDKYENEVLMCDYLTDLVNNSDG